MRGAGRPLHPLAWWAWSLGLALATLRTTNPLLLGLIAAVVGFVVASRRSGAPWAGSFALLLRFGVVIVAIRVVVQMAFGARLGGHTLFVLPHVGLPSWAAGVSVGGPVTVEALLGSLWQGLRLAVLLLCFGAANSLASPYRLLRCLPAFLYDAAVAVTVALSFTPEVAATLAALRRARRLRGRPTAGAAGIRGTAVPVLSAALDRSLHLAASMDSRGYGRRADASPRVRRAITALTGTGVLAVCAGVYWTLSAGAAHPVGIAAVAAGVAALGAAMAAGGRTNRRTRYRPDAWQGAEWSVVAAGTAALVAFAATSAGLQPGVYPLAVPHLPVLPTLAVVACLLPAFVGSAAPAGGGRERGSPTDGRRRRRPAPVDAA